VQRAQGDSDFDNVNIVKPCETAMHPGPSFLDMKMQCSCASKPHPGVATHAEAVSTLCAVACSGGKENLKHGGLRLFVGESLDGPLRHPEAARLAQVLALIPSFPLSGWGLSGPAHLQLLDASDQRPALARPCLSSLSRRRAA
jgi:hypothetical protein